MILIFLVGCVGLGSGSYRQPNDETQEGTQALPTNETPSNQPPSSLSRPKLATKNKPRAVAALTLIEQGRALIKAKRHDEAIRVLERAMNLNPQSGEIYYYLADAWLAKGNIQQALEYNHLAQQYSQSSPGLGNRISRQKKHIQNR